MFVGLEVILHLLLGHLVLLHGVGREREQTVGFRFAHEVRRVRRVEILHLGVLDRDLVLERLGIERDEVVRDLLQQTGDRGLRLAGGHDHAADGRHRDLLHADHGADGLLEVGIAEPVGREIVFLVLRIEFGRELAVLLERGKRMDDFGDFAVAGLDVHHVGGLQEQRGLERRVLVERGHARRRNAVGSAADHGRELAGVADVGVGHGVAEHVAVLRIGTDISAEQQGTVHARGEEPHERDDDDCGENGKCNFPVLDQHVVHFLNDHGVSDLWLLSND